MAIDYSIRITMDGSTVTNNEKAEILRKVVQALETQTINLTYAAGFTIGSGTTDNVNVAVT